MTPIFTCDIKRTVKLTIVSAGSTIPLPNGLRRSSRSVC
ncbi:hypothetical protein [Caudoviricetes sp.]|nr:hypothetical protein [Caudoviricetes sp.]